jgi:glycogen debranching enzyme
VTEQGAQTNGSDETPWTFNSSSVSGVDDGPSVTLVDGSTFAVSDRSGDINGADTEGLYLSDTRMLDRLVVTIDGSRVEPLSVIPNGPFSATFVGRTTPKSGQADSPLSVIRRRHVGRGIREDLEIRNHSAEPVQIHVEMDAGSDFASLFDVKSGRARDAVSAGRRMLSDGVDLSNHDGTMHTVLRFQPPCDDDNGWYVTVPGRGSWQLCTEISVKLDDASIDLSYRCGDPVADAIPVRRLDQWRNDVPSMRASDPRIQRATDQAIEDLGALRIFDPDHPDRVVVAAGAPWFMTLFGRDSILAAWMALLVDHDLARGVLHSLAELQGTTENPITEEQPGKILHEVRFDPATARSLGGHNIYYGTADATPLFVMLLAEYWRWTADRDLIEELLPHADRALDWIHSYGDRDGDGYVEYQRATPSGLENQGWKDSWDGIRHRDGTIAETPIALCEVQAYVYGALTGRADMAEAVGDQVTADQRRAEAASLKERFNRDFWLEDEGTFAVGLDANKQPIASITSNPGHCLWTGIVDIELAARVAKSLGSPELASGWGLRTLSSDNPGYNPLSYHCGSVWPHDTAIAVAGLTRYGYHEIATDLAEDLLDASTFTNGRLPELFAGFGADDLPAPIPYPSSCSPQAWAAAAPLLLVRSLLGLEPDAPNGNVRLRRTPVSSLAGFMASGIPFAGDRISITFQDDETRLDGEHPNITLTHDTELDHP